MSIAYENASKTLHTNIRQCYNGVVIGGDMGDDDLLGAYGDDSLDGILFDRTGWGTIGTLFDD